MAGRADSEDYYAVLGVGPEATEDDLRRAYRARAMELHPDRMAGATDEEKRIAGEKLKAVNRANEVLGDAAGRERYHAEWLLSHSLPRPVLDVGRISFKETIAGEKRRASFVVKNDGGPYQRVRITNPDSWVRVVGYQSLSNADELPLRVEIEAQGAEWDRSYRETIKVSLDDEEVRLPVTLHTRSGPESRARPHDDARLGAVVSEGSTTPRQPAYQSEANPRMMRAINTASRGMKYAGRAGAVLTLFFGAATVVSSFQGGSGIFMALLTAPLFAVLGAIGGAVIGGLAGAVLGAVYGSVDRG